MDSRGKMMKVVQSKIFARYHIYNWRRINFSMLSHNQILRMQRTTQELFYLYLGRSTLSDAQFL
ncbi:Uncharacterised protein [Chromobacterium vaccinii]|nr:Uncharacterised protein [Chromobacterium vaccinii]